MSLVHYGGEVIDAEVVESTAIQPMPTVSAGLARAEIDAQIATARAYPRKVAKCLREAETLVTERKDVAAKCLYSLPARSGNNKPIEGPSARLAEFLASAWGNLRVTGRIVEENDRFIIAQGQCVDLERNNGRQIEVRRRITDRYGKRYSDDMIAQTANAAISIATRNAILAVIPRALWEPVYQAARAAAVGKLESMEETRKSWMDNWTNAGIRPDEVFKALGVHGVQDITLDHCVTMTGWDNALRDGETTLEAIFHPAPEPVKSAKAEALVQNLKDAKAKDTAPKASPNLFNKPAREPGEDG